MDKQKLKEMMLNKKELDDRAAALQKEQMEWNKKFVELTGQQKMTFEDLILKVIDDDQSEIPA
jgi:uncharacterized protein YhaN